MTIAASGDRTVAVATSIVLVVLQLLLSLPSSLLGVAAVNVPVRQDVLVLCNRYCQSSALYTTVPTELKELDIYRLSRLLEPVIGLHGGQLVYLANLDLTSSTTAALSLIRAKLKADSTRIGTVVAFSDLKIVGAMPALLSNTSVELGLWPSSGSDSSAALDDTLKYRLVVVDDAFSMGGAHAAATHIDAPAFADDMVSVATLYAGRVSTVLVAPFPDALGYVAGAAAAAACADVAALRGGSAASLCHVAVLSADPSVAARIARAGINNGLATSGAAPFTVASSGAFLVEGDLLHHDVLGIMEGWEADVPRTIDVVVMDGPVWSEVVALTVSGSAPLHAIERNVTANATHRLGLPLLLSIGSNLTSTSASAQQAMQRMTASYVLDLHYNFTQTAAQLVSLLFLGVPSSRTAAVMLANLQAHGVCAQPPLLAAGSTHACSVWRLRIGAGFASTTLPPQPASSSSTTGSFLAAQQAALQATASSQAQLSSGLAHTQFDYRYGRWRMANAWRQFATGQRIAINTTSSYNGILALALAYNGSDTNTTSSTSGATEALSTSIQSILPFGIDERRFFLNPKVLQFPGDVNTALIFVPADGEHIASSSNSASSFGTSFYDHPLAAYRYDLTSNSIDRLVVSSNASGAAVLPYVPYQSMEVSAALKRVYAFGGVAGSGTGALNRMLAADVAGGIGLLFYTEHDGATNAPYPVGRSYATLTAESDGTAMYLYGGLCAANLPCDDLWRYDGTRRVWVPLYNASSPSPSNVTWNPPATGRYLHGAAYAVVTVELATFTGTHWLVVAGGRYTTILTNAYAYAINVGTWVRVGASTNVVVRSLIPCVQFIGTRLVFTLFEPSPSSPSVSSGAAFSGSYHNVASIAVFNLVDFNWGRVVVDDWVVNPGQCATVASFTQASHAPPTPQYLGGQTSLLVGSGAVGADRPFAIHEYTVKDCSALWTSNFYSGSSGLDCLQCPAHTFAEDPLRILCTACPANDADIPHPWQLAFCYVSDLRAANTAFVMIVFLQVLAVPLLVVFSNAIARSSAWEEDEFVVTELCESISNMMLERVAFLEHLEHPTRLQEALARCVANIKVYRRLIPTTVLHYADYVGFKARQRGHRLMLLQANERRQDPQARQGGGGGGALSATSPISRATVLSPGDLALDVEMTAAVSATASSVSMTGTHIDDDDNGFGRSSSSYTSDSSYSSTTASDNPPQPQPRALGEAGPSMRNRRNPSAPVSRTSSMRRVPRPATLRRNHSFSGDTEGGAYSDAGGGGSSVLRGGGSRRGGGGIGSGQPSMDGASGAGGAVPPAVPSVSISNAVLLALEPRLKTKRLTVMWMRLDGFQQWQESYYNPKAAAKSTSNTSSTPSTGHTHKAPPPVTTVARRNPAEFLRKYNAVVDHTLQIIQEHHGVPEAFIGDSVLATWNGLKPCDNAEMHALHAAHNVNSNPTIRSTAHLRATVSVGSGKAYVGIMGGDGSKRAIVLSPTIEECMQLTAHCRARDVGSLVEWTPHLQHNLSDEFVFRIVAVGHFHRSARKGGGQWAASAGVRDGVDPGSPGPSSEHHRESHRVRPGTKPPHVALLAELLGPTTLTQWQYELKGHKEYVDCFNTVVRTVFDGRLDDARRIPLPRSMPRWYQSELQHVMDTGALPAVDIYS